MQDIHCRYRSITLLTITLLSSVLLGCGVYYNAPIVPPQGLLFTSNAAPLTSNFNNLNTSSSLKKYSECKTFYFYYFLWPQMDFAWGDADVADAARRGGIGKISYTDYEFLNVLGIYSTFTINIYGDPIDVESKGSDTSILHQ